MYPHPTIIDIPTALIIPFGPFLSAPLVSSVWKCRGSGVVK
jgi:hypothetical protein